MKNKTIVEFSFWEFCQAVQKAVQEGYVFSSDNDKFPSGFVGHYTATLVPTSAQERNQEPVNASESVSEGTPRELEDIVVVSSDVSVETSEPKPKAKGKKTK